MNHRFFTREEMVSVTVSLTDKAHDDHRAIMSYPLAAALLELVVAAHERLLRTQRLGPTPERLIEVGGLLTGLDLRHDDVLRGVYFQLSAQEYMAKTPELKAAIRKLRIKMFPEQLRATRKSYRGQAGQAALLKSRLIDSDRELLGSLNTADGRTLMDVVEEWFELAEAMGELENERSGGEGMTPSAADVLEARHGWGRAVDAFVSTLRLRDDVPPAIVSILDRIETTALQVSRRYARGNRNPDSESPEDDSELPDEVDGSELPDDVDGSELPDDIPGGADESELPEA